MTSISTKEKLLLLLDDVELITNVEMRIALQERELLENSIAQKTQRMSSAEQSQLIQLLLIKDKDLKSAMKVAGEQAKIASIMESVRGEVDKHDLMILQLEKQLYEASQTLSVALYQARQKLDSISRANKRPVNSEELIKYAHRISSTYSVASPVNWQQGDPRRPYPTDHEMRAGFLGQNGQLLHSQSQLSDSLTRGPHSGVGGTFSWQPSGEISVHVGGHSSVVEKKDADDVEVMSSDSSSSSSSDSQ